MLVAVKHRAMWFVGWLLTVEPQPFQAGLGLFTITWSFWFWSPFWSIFGRSPVLYQTLAAVMGETAWGLLMLSLGVGLLYHSLRPVCRGSILVTITATAVWAFVTMAFLLANWQITSIPIYGWLTVGHAWLTYRLRGEYANSHGSQ